LRRKVRRSILLISLISQRKHRRAADGDMKIAFSPAAQLQTGDLLARRVKDIS
jgi:hypothetical protein